jgi:hypothetical protein
MHSIAWFNALYVFTRVDTPLNLDNDVARLETRRSSTICPPSRDKYFLPSFLPCGRPDLLSLSVCCFGAATTTAAAVRRRRRQKPIFLMMHVGRKREREREDCRAKWRRREDECLESRKRERERE